MIKAGGINRPSKPSMPVTCFTTSLSPFLVFFSDESKKILQKDIQRARLNPLQNTIIISRMNTPELVGECGYVEKTLINHFIPDRLWMTKFKKNSNINVKWLSYILSFPLYKKSIKNIATGTSASMKNISKPALLEIKIPYPSLFEQTAIATALNDADALITQLEKLIAKKRNIKQGAMQELLKPKEGWEVRKLGDCLRHNPDYGINAAAVLYNESLPVYLRITDITEDGKYSKENVVSVDNISSSDYYLEKGDLVFARTGASVGKTYLYDTKDGRLVFAGFLIRIKTNPEMLIPEYFQFYTQTSLYWDWIRANSMRTGQPGINGNEYKELIIMVFCSGFNLAL